MGASQSGPVQTVIIFHMQYFPNALFVPLYVPRLPSSNVIPVVHHFLPPVISDIIFTPHTNPYYSLGKKNEWLTHSSMTIGAGIFSIHRLPCSMLL